MIESKVLAGLVAALPLALMAVIYALTRGKALAGMLRLNDKTFTRMPGSRLTLVITAMFVIGALVLGMLSGWVYSLVNSPDQFRLLALVLAIVFSMAAIISRTPMRIDKIAMNAVVALVLGWLVPILARP